MSNSKKEFQELTGDDLVKELQESVAQIKQSREMGELYMTLQDLLDDEYEEGMMAGIEKGRASGIKEGSKAKLLSQVEKKLAKGNTPEEIADILEEDISVILEIVGEINIADDNS